MSNITKFNAYKRIAKNYLDAVNILNERPLVLGEPAVVPFYYPSEDDPDRIIKLVIGVGSINGQIEILSNINYDSSTRINDATI